MNKKMLVAEIIKQLESEHAKAVVAANASREAATNEESQPENEYDTRALEESYLAGAYSKRVAEIEEQITYFKFIQLKDFPKDSAIGATAVVELEHLGKIQWVFLTAKGGGIHCSFDGKSIQVVTASSPLGEALQGLRAGDDAIVEVGATTKEYEVISVR